MVKTVMKSLLKDILSLKEKTSENLLMVQMFDGKLCHLVNPICSTSYQSFKANVVRKKWMDELLLSVNDDKELAAEWIMTFLGDKYEEIYTEVAVQLGLLLPPMVMDAESACAMWEEANCPYKSQ
jgi:hypothetical protein